MAEARAPVSEPRYWKITVNPQECAQGAWEVSRTAGLAMLGLPGEEGETHYAVKNLKRIQEGDWLVAYTPQEGSYTVGGIGRVVRGYRCEEGPFDHPWNGPVRRSVGVDWEAGSCRINDLVEAGRFRKGKIARLVDEILPEEFEPIRARVQAMAAPRLAAHGEWDSTLRDALAWLAERENRTTRPPASPPAALDVTETRPEPVVSPELKVTAQPAVRVLTEESVPELPVEIAAQERSMELFLEAPTELAREDLTRWAPELPVEVVWEVSEERVIDLSVLEGAEHPGAEPVQQEAVKAEREPQATPGMEPLRPSPVVLDPTAEPPPLPAFFLEMAQNEPAPIFKMDEPVGPWRQPTAAAPGAAPPAMTAMARPHPTASASRPPKSLAESAAALRRSHEAQLLAGFGLEPQQEILDFGLPTMGEDELPLEELEAEALSFDHERVEPFEVRVGTLGWTGIFRREIESGRPCSLLLRGPQYSFLNMAQPGVALRGLPLFALFAIGAVSAPGKEALRSGATFIFQGRRASGDYAVEVRPRQRRPAARAPVEVRH